MLEMVEEEVWGVTCPCEGTRPRSHVGAVAPQPLQVGLAPLWVVWHQLSLHFTLPHL